MSKLLFIGGCADGQRIETKGKPYFRVMKSRPLLPNPLPLEYPDIEPSIFEHEEYQAVRFREGKTEFLFMALVGDDESPMSRLVAGYRPGEAMEADIGAMGSRLDLSEDARRKFVKHLARTGKSRAVVVMKD